MIEVVTPLPSYTDERGETTNLLSTPVNVAIIRSRDGAIRGNHVHKQGGHFEYVIEGTIEVKRRTNMGDIETEILHPGQMVFTPPRVEHAFRSVGESAILHITTIPIAGGLYEQDTEKVSI